MVLQRLMTCQHPGAQLESLDDSWEGGEPERQLLISWESKGTLRFPCLISGLSFVCFRWFVYGLYHPKPPLNSPPFGRTFLYFFPEDLKQFQVINVTITKQFRYLKRRYSPIKGKIHPQNSLIRFSTSILGTWNVWWNNGCKIFLIYGAQRFEDQTAGSKKRIKVAIWWIYKDKLSPTTIRAPVGWVGAIPIGSSMFTYMYHKKTTKCRQIYHTWILWDLLIQYFSPDERNYIIYPSWGNHKGLKLRNHYALREIIKGNHYPLGIF